MVALLVEMGGLGLGTMLFEGVVAVVAVVVVAAIVVVVVVVVGMATNEGVILDVVAPSFLWLIKRPCSTNGPGDTGTGTPFRSR